MMGTILFYLIIIIGIFYIIVKLLAKKNVKWLTYKNVKKIGGVFLGQNKSVQLIQIGQSIYVVGVGDNIQLLDKITDEVEVSELVSNSLQKTFDSSQSFRLPSWFYNLKAHKHETNQQDEVSEFQKVFESKINSISRKNTIVEEWMHEKQQERSIKDE
ncbi:MAG: hypothetical protein A2189_09310 [Paenibacillus sp. RIFOXYA1_FULL_44_5]|nr:MAG: hypothetical protein A2189_09310 [Paenibacillus sp. RIFOXYA1_FULL_44_5]